MLIGKRAELIRFFYLVNVGSKIMASDKLTIKQEKYCNERIKGKSQRQAYKAAYPDDKSTDKTIDESACRLESSHKVSARLAYLRSLDNDKAIANKNDIAKMLTDIANDDTAALPNRLKALDQLAKINGAYNDNLSVNISGGILTGKDKASAIKDYIESLK